MKQILCCARQAEHCAFCRHKQNEQTALIRMKGWDANAKSRGQFFFLVFFSASMVDKCCLNKCNKITKVINAMHGTVEEQKYVGGK